jgi:hypothetical protein
MPVSNLLESEGAEFLVLGQLLIEGIDAYKSYRNNPGYDLVAVAPEKDRTARIQIKSRWPTNANGFLIRNLDCDFVVFAKLNRGDKKKSTVERRSPECYVFPIALIKGVHIGNSSMPKVRLNTINGLEKYKENWGLVRDFLTSK